MKSLGQLINRWKDERLALLPAASELAIRETFRSLGYSATTDVLALYTAVGGMEEMDKVSWRLWPLTEIKNENGTSSSSGVLFSDFAADCWRFRLKANSGHTSAVLVDNFAGRAPVQVADSLETFFHMYLTDPVQLFWGNPIK